MLGVIGLENFSINCIIGIYPEERTTPQNIFVDLKVEVDVTSCMETENIANTVCYATLGQVCTEVATKGNFLLLENYSSELMEELLMRFPINWVWIKVKKPVRFMAGSFATVELKMERHELDTSDRKR